VTGGSEFESQRFFGGLKTDERRTGGRMRVELELFRRRPGHIFGKAFGGLFRARGRDRLSLFAEGGSQTVALRRDDVTTARQNLSTLDLGASYRFDLAGRGGRTRVEMQPRLRLGFGRSAAEPAFSTLLLVGRLQRREPWRYVFDIAGRFEQASMKTPLFELPSFGGAETVRGFRRDDAIGRRIWSLQPELWLPLPGSTRSRYKSFSRPEGVRPSTREGLREFLRDNLWLAPFFDLGGAHRTTGSRSGLRAGPGLGLRLDYSQVIFKLDWAYGLGEAATTNRGRGRFYFNVTTNLPF
jgi:hemolysin activation/secretion protein